jgi:ZIP family zinc transporter
MYLVITAAGMVAGGVLAAFAPVTDAAKSYVQHFAAGLVFGAVALKVFPTVRSELDPLAFVLAFAIGGVAMVGMKTVTDKLEDGQGKPQQQAALPMGLIASVAADSLVDGFTIGVGFALSGDVGVLLALGLAGEWFSEGLAIAAEVKGSRWRAIGVPVGIAAVAVLGGVVGLTLLTGLATEAIAFLMAAGSAALVFLVTEGLLVKAHQNVRSVPATAALFAGIVAFMLLNLAA